MSGKLAIVIPFYKADFFGELLESLSNQSNNDFSIYVGDDCSPDDISPHLEKYKQLLNIEYFRFSDRLGNKSLTEQWHRCLALTKKEEWVWFLPDDDLPSMNVVECFYEALKEEIIKNVNVMTIPTQTIDAKGNNISAVKPVKRIEDNYNFYLSQLKGETSGSSLGDNIFRKSALINSGGFVDFPKAWGSDHATILKVSANSQLYGLQGAVFHFRQSGINISSDQNDGKVKMRSRVLFARWLKENETIFSRKPQKEFYKYFYWKGEYYFMNEWRISFSLIYLLFRLKNICMGSYFPFSIFLLSIKKLKNELYG